jgi:hypothetical protein
VATVERVQAAGSMPLKVVIDKRYRKKLLKYRRALMLECNLGKDLLAS